MTFPYTKRYGGGFVDLPTQTTSIDSTFLNAVETALVNLMYGTPTANQVPVYDNATSTFKPQTLSLVNADIASAAAIAYSKLALTGSIVNADIASAAAIGIAKLAGYPTDATKFLRGDATWAVPVASITTITDTLLGSAAASFDFTSIPATYKTLLVRGVLRSDTAAGTVNPYVRFNNDSAGNYDYEIFQVTNAAGLTSSANVTQAQISAGVVPAANARASRPGFFELSIPLYAETTFEKVCESRTWSSDPGVNQFNGNVGAAWRSTVAISRVTILPSAGNWITGSHLTLYGIA